ncbi:BON domain-containing protein [Phormidesmis priestleyi ULC007]|uniref:BON domain-containing protein n=1 Tax=Phormidesmis priestleyi ULC007 TaxID=1920490 RepID=A0A2T1DK91_9CYAN|nr:BON domain-containing protein [Phormidesmis priestleyi]PSB20871.1 BON domain-containing protein [Phormidesmis priestleyi ULC007]PZO51826.1 MAG: BON domain-containing protein [Phormidesmis priestleyi]
MNKITLLILSSLLMLGSVACSDASKTSSSAPDTTAKAGDSLDKSTAQSNQADATNETRRKQLDSNIRANEQRNSATNDGSANRSDAQIKSEVSSKLEANLPASQLAIDAKDGVVTVSGTVVAQDQLAKIDKLSREIKGVRDVQVKATLKPSAKP